MNDGEIRQVGAALQRLATMDRLTDEASQRVYHGRSAAGTVVACVDGNGWLLSLEVDPAALRAPGPERTGPEIVAAVTAARAAAADDKAQQVRRHLGTG